MIEKNEIITMVESHGAWAMSDFQTRYFVVNSQVTDYRRVRQALLEIETRLGGKKQIERNMWKCKVEIALKKEERDAESHPLKKELISVDIDQLEYDLSVYDKKLKVSEEELAKFCEIVASIVPDNETLESYKVQDEEKEREYWIARMGKQACMDIMTMGRIGQGNLDSIAMMPLNDQEETIKVALTYSAVLGKAIGSVDEKVRLELQNLKTDDDFKLLSSFNRTDTPLLNDTKVSSEEL
jgi:hypothetical protein